LLREVKMLSSKNWLPYIRHFKLPRKNSNDFPGW